MKFTLFFNRLTFIKYMDLVENGGGGDGDGRQEEEEPQGM